MKKMAWKMARVDQCELTKKFGSASIHEIKSVYEEFRDSSSDLETEIERVLEVSGLINVVHIELSSGIV